MTPHQRNSNLRYYSFSLDRELEGVKADLDGIRIGKATPKDFFISRRSDVQDISLRRVLVRGDDYFVARAEKQIVSIGRICYADTEDLALDKAEASLISFYTVPDFRGRGLYGALINSMLKHLKKRHFSTCYIWASKDNKASLAGIEKAGFVPL
jgi:GNAT superfamily N-acetyltransferase